MLAEWQITVAVALGLVLPLALALLSSPEVRRALRGTGSIRQTLSNAGVGALFLLAQLGLRGALLGFYGALASRVPWKLPEANPASFLLGFVLLELVYYVQHRLEHRVPILWAVHAVHHQSRDYNLSVSFRVGVFSSLSTALFHSLLALAGVSLTQYALLVSLQAVLLFALHARTRFTLGPGRFFNAPVFHRVHHASDSEYIDKNFGGVLLLFDRLCGTFAPLESEPKYGVLSQRSPLDPLDANLSPWLRLFERMRSERTLRNKLRVLFVTQAK